MQGELQLFAWIFHNLTIILVFLAKILSLEALDPKATRNNKKNDTLDSAWLLVLIAGHLQLVSKLDLLTGGSAKW